MGKVTIEYIEKDCIGCGACAAVCPNNWEMADNDKAVPIATELDEVGCNQEAADACPMDCIKIKEA